MAAVLGTAGVLGLLVACDGGSGRSAGSSRPGATPEDGRYHVTGVTIDDSSGAQRPVQGTVNLQVEGSSYTTHFELDTLFPGSPDLSAEVIGTGEGTVEGNRLDGTAELQIHASTVPGVDAGFAFIPHAVSPRVESTSTAEFFADGSVRMEIRNRAAEGAEYTPTRTTLVGYRLEGG